MTKRLDRPQAKADKTAELSNDTEAAQHWQQIARQVLAEHGENPDYWIIAASQSTDKAQLRFLCATPPCLNQTGYAGPLLEQALAANLALSIVLIRSGSERELGGLACASLGFLANRLADFKAAADFGSKMNPGDYPSDFCQVVHLKRQPDPASAIRAAIQALLQLGYQRLARPFSPDYTTEIATTAPTPNFSHQSATLAALHPAHGLVIGVKPEGSLVLTAFRPEATFAQFYDTLTASAAKAKLLRLRQGAKNCGGCGRCCSDANIPLTYFDLRSVAAHHFAALFEADPVAALIQTKKIMSQPVVAVGSDNLSVVQAAELYFRKKNGTSEGDTPCVFLDGQGFCGVYEGRPLLCRLYHCASSSPAVEAIFNSTFNTIEWLGRVVESGLWQLHPNLAAANLSLNYFLQQPLARLANPYALAQACAEVRLARKI